MASRKAHSRQSVIAVRTNFGIRTGIDVFSVSKLKGWEIASGKPTDGIDTKGNLLHDASLQMLQLCYLT